MDQLKEQFPDVTFTQLPDGDTVAEVPAERYHDFALAARDVAGYTFLSCLSGADYKDHLQTAAHVFKMEPNQPGLVIRVNLPTEDPHVASVTDVWPTANWHEREAYDMYGIVFDNHPRLLRILLPDNWQGGHPLRKDFGDKRPKRPRLVRYRGEATTSQ